MLVLTRKVNQRIVIGEGPDQVVLVVTSILRGQVRLGFLAPPTVRIDRQEVREVKVACGQVGAP